MAPMDGDALLRFVAVGGYPFYTIHGILCGGDRHTEPWEKPELRLITVLGNKWCKSNSSAYMLADGLSG